PKHPCMDSSASYRSASSIAVAAASRVGLMEGDPAQHDPEMPQVLMVFEVEERARKRLVTLGASGEALVQVLVSPPAPPVFAIAVAATFELHWFDPRAGEKGKNLIWQRTYLRP